ncbi:MAG: glycoside hydrolase family 78 protein [Opitutaceae bacterium]|jgi:hypothetical protein|nr:glycoside hydrolase family 78 protein [Opitutaceae bacterium]
MSSSVVSGKIAARSAFDDLVVPSARWMWPGNLSFDLHNCYAIFRKVVALERAPARARTLVTADQSYRLYVNGHYVCRGPARGFQRSWPCDEVDLAPWLRAGRNVIAIRAHNPGFGNYQYVFAGIAGVLFSGRWVCGADAGSGETVEVVSDKTWVCRRQAGVTRDTLPSSFQLFCQEHVDARVEPDDWMSPEFDEGHDAGGAWGEPSVNAAWNCEPWHTLEPRGTPLLTEEEVAPARLLGRGTGVCANGFMDTRNVVKVARCEALWHEEMAGRTGGGEGSLPLPGAGGFVSWLFDFGHTVVGNLRLRIGGAEGGELVDAVFTETVEHDKERGVVAPHLHQEQVSLGSRLICRAGVNDHTFFHPYGFRYLMIRARNVSVSLDVTPTVRTIGYPLERGGRFFSSDEALNRIWETCARTQQVCSLDAYVDTPWREQAQWWGDARVQAWNTFHLVDDARLFRRGIRCIARQTTPDGLTYGHAPTIAHHCILPDFSLIWVITLWDDFWQTGSLEMFRDTEIRRTLAGVWGYFRRWTDRQTGLVRFDPRHWLFLDWAELTQRGQPALLSLWLLMALEKTAELHVLAGEPADALGLREWAAELRGNLLRLRDAEDGLLRDGCDESGNLVARKSIHTQTLALLTCLLPDTDAEREGRAALAGALRAFVRTLTPPAPTTPTGPSIYWLTYVFSALDEFGGDGNDGECEREIVAYIRHYWTQMAEHGTTWSQLKEYGGTQSHSHAWSAHPLFHYMRIIGGIRQTAAGWARIVFRPCFWDEHASVSVPTPHGIIHAHWARCGDTGYRVELQLPAGITAHVLLPGIDETHAGGSHQWEIVAGWKCESPAMRIHEREPSSGW